MTTDDPYAAGVTQPTDTPPAPGAGAPAPDPSGLDLSDTANQALYPDVEHPDTPPPVNPDDVPPPIQQHESPLMDIIRAYASGQTDWPTAKQALIDFQYAEPPPRVGSPIGPSKGQWWQDVEADIGTSAADNTWAQLQEAVAAGMLSRDERNQVLAARAAHGQEADQAAGDGGGDPTPTEGKAIPFDPHKHPRAAHGPISR